MFVCCSVNAKLFVGQYAVGKLCIEEGESVVALNRFLDVVKEMDKVSKQHNELKACCCSILCSDLDERMCHLILFRYRNGLKSFQRDVNVLVRNSVTLRIEVE